MLEQIAAALGEEGKYQSALPRYVRLVELTRDDYRRALYRIEATQIKIRLSRRSEGLADMESLLADLNPEGWLFKDVRRRIEDVFLKSADQDGLVKYYEGWVATHPEDVDAMARLAKYLGASARMPEAIKWLEKALALAHGTQAGLYRAADR